MNKGKFFLKSVLILIVLLSTVSCSEKSKKDIVVGTTDWPECVALSRRFKEVAEEKTEYNIILKEMNVDMIYEQLASGGIDLFFDAWLPVTHDTYIVKYGENLEKISKSFSGARIGLVVPGYVTISSIEELEKFREKFGGKIQGIESSAGIMKTAVNAIREYGLSYELVESNSEDMMKAVEQAVNNNEWIVFTGWSPHAAFGKWDLKYLSDYREIFGLQEDIWILSRKGFSKEYPKIHNILIDFKISKEEMSKLLLNLE